jgi:hypothetical protein
MARPPIVIALRSKPVVDTFWLKVAAAVVVIIAVVVGIVMLMPAKREEPKEPPKTIYDMAEKDRQELLAAPGANDFSAGAEPGKQVETTAAAEQPEPTPEPIVLYFTELSEEEKIGAENILANIPSFRTIGRLPITGYKAMVDSCRLLMSRWPGSEYDYKARRALAQVPKRFWERYKITEEEVDLEYFRQQRPNTIPYTVTEDN